jgi:1-acyl-sn-glycerol-3-phosphate acyltransferase
LSKLSEAVTPNQPVLSRIEDVVTRIPRSHRAAVQDRVLATIRGFLAELGNSTAIDSVRGRTNLENDLGFGSTERLELLARLEESLGTSLPEAAIADANTVDDVIAAVAAPPEGGGTHAIRETLGESASYREGSSGVMDSGTREDISETAARDLGGRPDYDGGRPLWCIWERIYGVYAATVFLLWLVVTWLIVLIMPRGQPAARMTSTAIRLCFKAMGCPIHVEGKEHTDGHGACIYVSNHTSYSDVPIVMSLLKTNYHFVAKNEINDMPFIGTFLRKLGHFAFERTKLRERSRQAGEMEQALRRGESLFVFAEGTFTAQPGVRPFHLGAFRAAVKAARPIIPVALKGARRFLQDGTFLPRPSRVVVTFGPPVIPAAEAGREWAEVLRLRDETRRIISVHSGEPLLHTPES